jgi:hypothetical protein
MQLWYNGTMLGLNAVDCGFDHPVESRHKIYKISILNCNPTFLIKVLITS